MCFSNQFVKLYLNLGTFLSSWDDGPARPWHIKNANNDRAIRAEQKSVLWIERNMHWHVKNNPAQYKQLLNNFLIKHKQDIFELFGWKHWQLNVHQAHELQQIANVLEWQMEIIQKYFRHTKGIILLPNSKARRDYRKIFYIPSAMVHTLPLQVPQTLVNRQQYKIQSINVYHVDEIEAIGQLAESIFKYGRFYVQEPLTKSQWIWGVGWDRSVSALAESGSLSITAKYHGKYGSVITTLTGPKAAENSFNYRQLTNQWNKRCITNQLLKYPNVIIVTISKHDNGVLVSKNVAMFVMSLNNKAQKEWNESEQNRLKSIESPPIRRLRITKQQIKAAIKAVGEHASKTDKYWQQRHETLNLHSFIAVKLPPGLQSPKESNNNRWSTERVQIESTKLLDEAKNTSYKFQPKSDKIKMNLKKSQRNNNNVSNDAVPAVKANIDSTDVDIDLTSVNLNISVDGNANSDVGDVDIHLLGQNVNASCDGNDNTNDRSVSKSHNSDSSFNINDEDLQTEDGNHVIIPNLNYNNSYCNDNGNDNSNDNLNDNSNDNNMQHTLFALHCWKFNATSSTLTRMAEDEWNWRRMHATAATAQGNLLYELKFECFGLHEWNVNLPLHNTNETAQIISTDLLFDHDTGIKYFYLPHANIPMFNDQLDTCYRFFAVTVQGLLFGLLQVKVTDESPTEHCSNGTYLGRKCEIQQRCSTSNKIDLNCVDWDEKDSFKSKMINLDLNLVDEMGSSNVSFNDKNGKHVLNWFSVDLKTMLQFDNSAKNMIAGLTKASGTYPCPNCEAKGQDIYSFPTPQTMCFRTRNIQQSAQRAAQLNGKLHEMGCKESPIYECPPHRFAGSILHDMEGIFAVILSCIKTYINKYTSGSNKVVVLQSDVDFVYDKFGEIMRLQDIRDFLADQSKTPEIEQQINEINDKLHVLVPDYEKADAELQTKLNVSNNEQLIAYLSILKKYKINEYYCMKGSVQGVMCKRICKARQELTALLKNVFYVGGILWELLFQNINYLYSMLKHKHTTKFTNFELASMKHSYIDFYHQLVLVVRLWRNDGDLTIKPHYLLHDVEQSFLTGISNAYTDEERIENVNQLIKATMRLYQNCQGNRFGSKEMFVGRRMNNRVFSCG